MLSSKTVPRKEIRTIMEPRWGTTIENLFTSPRVAGRKASLTPGYLENVGVTRDKAVSGQRSGTTKLETTSF